MPVLARYTISTRPLHGLRKERPPAPEKCK